jgi:hypothetical protein
MPLPRLLVLLSFLGLVGCQGEPPPATAPAPPVTVDHAPATPRLVLKETVLDAGEIDFGHPQNYVFPIHNAGTGPLRLTLTRKSCSCAGVEVPDAVPPGKDDAITLHWSPIPGKTGVETFAVDLETNDPRQHAVRLAVKGRVTPLIRVVPEDWSFIDFNQVRPGGEERREIKVMSARLASFGLQASVSSRALEAAVTPLPSDGGAVDYLSGYRVVLKTTPRLTSGFFRETLSLNLHIPEEGQRTVTLPVYGEVENGLFEVRPREIEFKKPRVADEDSKRILVQFFVPSKNEAIVVARSELSFLTFDQPKRLKAGLWEFTLRLPANSPAAGRFQADGFFEGRLFLQATGSDAEVPVRVKWVRPES